MLFYLVKGLLLFLYHCIISLLSKFTFHISYCIIYFRFQCILHIYCFFLLIHCCPIFYCLVTSYTKCFTIYKILFPTLLYIENSCDICPVNSTDCTAGMRGTCERGLWAPFHCPTCTNCTRQLANLLRQTLQQFRL